MEQLPSDEYIKVVTSCSSSRSSGIDDIMLLKIVAFAIFAFVDNIEAKNVWTGLAARWSANPTDGFYALPQNRTAAEGQGWTQVSGVGAPDDVLPLCYFNDPRVVLLFSKSTGRVIGIQVGFLVSDVASSGIPIDFGANPGLTMKTLNGFDFYTATALFHQDGQRYVGGSVWPEWKGKEATGTRRLWFEVNGKFEEIPTKPELVTLETPYYLKRCFVWMGLHYYQINSTTDCSYVFPWNLRRVNDDIVGFGIQMPGHSSSAPGREWFEDLDPSPNATRSIIPDAPTCLVDLLATYGIISLHIFLLEDPLDVVCMDECTAVYSNDGSYQTGNNEHRRSKRATGSANVC